MRAPWPDRLIIARSSWRVLHKDLRVRGQLRRESGAFLLAGPRSRRVEGWVLFDDLDPACLTGGISMQGVGFSRLWDLCDKHGLAVIADVHTHPGPGVGQSHIDAANPMIAQAGHVALILPNYAHAVLPAPRIGIHIYRGSRHWDPVPSIERDRHLIIRRRARPARRIVYEPCATQPPGPDVGASKSTRPARPAPPTHAEKGPS